MRTTSRCIGSPIYLNESGPAEARRVPLGRVAVSGHDEVVGADAAVAVVHQTKAAQMLGIARRTLISRIERYGLPRPKKP